MCKGNACGCGGGGESPGAAGAVVAIGVAVGALASVLGDIVLGAVIVVAVLLVVGVATLAWALTRDRPLYAPMGRPIIGATPPPDVIAARQHAAIPASHPAAASLVITANRQEESAK